MSAGCKKCGQPCLKRRRTCQGCESARITTWRRANPGYKKAPRDPAKDRARAYKRRYGITLEQYDKLLALQNGVCGICHKPPKPGRRLDVDHDHRTKVVRGLLHGMPCNKFAVGKHTLGSALTLVNYLSQGIDGRTL